MSLDMKYSAGGKSQSFQLSETEINLATELSAYCKEQVSLLFDVEGFGDGIEVDLLELINAVDTILITIEAHPELVPASYLMRFTEPSLGITFSDVVNVSGIQLEGEVGYDFDIVSGVGYCNLVKWRIEADGHGTKYSTADIRHLDRLTTINRGEIRIYSKRRKSTLSRNLKKLREFLMKSNDQKVRKMLC